MFCRVTTFVKVIENHWYGASMTVVRHVERVEIWALSQEAGTWKCPAAIGPRHQRQRLI